MSASQRNIDRQLPSVASRLVFLRKASGLSVREIRHLSGVDSAYLWRLEKGKQENPSFETAEALGAVYGVRREWLLHGTGEIFASPEESMNAFVNLPGVAKAGIETTRHQKLARDVAIRAAFFSSADHACREQLAGDIGAMVRHFAETAPPSERSKRKEAGSRAARHKKRGDS